MRMKRDVRRQLEAGFIFVFQYQFQSKRKLYGMRGVEGIVLHLIKNAWFSSVDENGLLKIGFLAA